MVYFHDGILHTNKQEQTVDISHNEEWITQIQCRMGKGQIQRAHTV